MDLQQLESRVAALESAAGASGDSLAPNPYSINTEGDVEQSAAPLPASVVSGSAAGATAIQPTTALGGALAGNLPSPTMRDWVSVPDAVFGGKGDWEMKGQTITITGGKLKEGTLSGVPAGLKAGQTMIIAGLTKALVVESINAGAKIVTFTTEASGAVTGAFISWGTDNTAALNAFFAYCIEHKIIGMLPAGKYLITGTVGWPDDSEGWSGLTVYCGGASANSGLYGTAGNIATAAGTTLIWGGAAGGTMMNFSRVQYAHWVGGLSLVGQPSYSPAEVFTTFGNRAGIGYLLAQTSTPETGTGYNFFDDLLCSDMDVPVQFATEQGSNNCDTTRFNRFVALRCNSTLIASGDQQMAYTIGFAHFIKCSRGIVLAGGGATDIQLLNVSGGIPEASREDAGATAANGVSTILDSAIRASDVGRAVTGTGAPAECYVGTVTPGVSFTIVTQPGSPSAAVTTAEVKGVTLGQVFTGIECVSGPNESNSHIGLVRLERGTYSAVYVKGNSQLNIDSFEEAETEAANKNLITVEGGNNPGGMLHIGQMTMFSYNETPSATNSPIYIGQSAARSGALMVDQAVWNGPGKQITKLTYYFFAQNNAQSDVTVKALRDRSGNTYNPINTRLQRGKCLLNNETTNETTGAILRQAGMPLTAVFSFGPQVPKGWAEILITIVGDRGDGTFSRFRRTLVVSRTTGEATTEFTTPTGWTDKAEGTDKIGTLSVTSNKTLNIEMKGTTGKTIQWQATVDMIAWTAAAAP